ncbi:hypothetical protein [Neptuniibacter sp. QD37_11]|uniref:hypothetical protein n=1 Tax=Neptuniibacter sp. QD37_11 TaxID=3398209 RepID=UPI0039F4DEBA
MSKKKYFLKYSEVLHQLINREDYDNPAIKDLIRYSLRQAINHATDLPGYDNKLGASLISEKALEQIENGDLDNLVGEHVVPVSEVNRILHRGNRSLETIKNHILSFSTRAVITKQEDDVLRELGLSKQMPKSWDGESSLDRYEVANIRCVNKLYKDVIKTRKG